MPNATSEWDLNNLKHSRCTRYKYSVALCCQYQQTVIQWQDFESLTFLVLKSPDNLNYTGTFKLTTRQTNSTNIESYKFFFLVRYLNRVLNSAHTKTGYVYKRWKRIKARFIEHIWVPPEWNASQFDLEARQTC